MPIPKPPVVMGFGPQQDLSELYMDPGFGGINLYNPPDQLSVGQVIQADDLYNVGGVMMIRPGKQAQLASAFGGAAYALGTMLDSSLNTWILVASVGKLYKIQNGTSTATEIKVSPGGASLSLANGGMTAQGVEYNGYFYFIDGSSTGSLYKTDLAYAYSVTALDEPTAAPAAGLVASGSLPGFWPNSASYDAPPSYATSCAACVATAATATGGGVTDYISSVTVVHGGVYPSGVTPAATIVDPTGSGAELSVTMSGTAVSTVSVVSGHAGSGYTNPVVVFTVPAGTACNFIPNSCFPFDSCNWTGYIPDSGPSVTSVWDSHDMEVYGTGPDINGSMGSAPIGAPTGASGTANYNHDTAGNDIAWACFAPTGATVVNTVPIGNIPHGDGSGEWASQFVLGFSYFQANTNCEIQVTVTAYTVGDPSSGHPIVQNFSPSTATASNVTGYPAGSMLFDFSNLQSATDHIYKWDISIESNFSIPHDLNGGLCIAYLTGGPVWGYLQTTPGLFSNGLYTTQRYQQGAAADGWIADTQPDDAIGSPPFNWLTKDARLTIGFGSGAAATLSFGGTGDQQYIASVSLASPGSGYLSETAIYFYDSSDTPGSGAAAMVTVVDGGISEINITNPGSGYSSAPSITLSGAGGGSGFAYTVNMTDSGTEVGSVTITNPGSGYSVSSPPGVTFIGGGSPTVTATATAVVANGCIESISLSEGGLGYTGSNTTAYFGQSFTGDEFVSVPLKGFGTTGAILFNYLNASLNLRLWNQATSQYEFVSLAISNDGTYASADLSVLDAVVLGATNSAQIQFIDNPVVSSSAFAFNIGNFTLSGNLAVGFAPYTYCYTEVDGNGDPNLVLTIQSDPSPYSNSITPTGAMASAQIQLPSSPKNTGVSDRFYLYRTGGTNPNDGEMTLVATARWDTPFAMGAQTDTDSPADLGLQLNPNPYVSWNDPSGPTPPAGTYYFVDNTPDQNLDNNPTLIAGREPAPAGCTAIAVYQNRLWLSVSGNIISSWLKNESSDAGDYFNQTVDPTDPNAPILGSGYQPVLANDPDPVMAMSVLGNVLTIWKMRKSFFLAGDDPTNFSINQYTAFEGQGLVAPKGIVTADNVIYLTMQDGIYTFNGSELQKISDPIGALLAPVPNEDDGPLLSTVYGVSGVVAASAYANVALGFHGGRLYVFAPAAGGSANSQCFLYDTRFPGWTGRWTNMNITSMASIGSSADDPDMWLGALDGQLYKMTGNGDISAAGGSASAVSFALTTRAYGRPPEGLTIWLQGRYNMPLGIEGDAWLPWFLRARVVRLMVIANCYNSAGAQSLTPTIGTLYLDSRAAATYPITIDGYQRQMVKTKPDRGGLGICVTLAGSTADNLQILGLGLTASRGAWTG